MRSPDFGHLGPGFSAAVRDLQTAGVHERPGTVLADAGYWHGEQMDTISADGTQILVPPNQPSAPPRGRAGPTAVLSSCARCSASDAGHALYGQRTRSIEPVFGQIKHNRGFRQFRRRGRAAARSEWRLITATHNVLKLHQHRIQPPPADRTVRVDPTDTVPASTPTPPHLSPTASPKLRTPVVAHSSQSQLGHPYGFQFGRAKRDAGAA